uniref:Cyclin-U4-1 n=1 Tax=Lygus hesperus TaxID=30085 RepID=A0A0A9WAX1_LYGHE
MERVVKQNESLANGGLFVPLSYSAHIDTTNNNGTSISNQSGVNNSNHCNNNTDAEAEGMFALFRSNNPTYSYITILSRLANYTYISPSTLLAAIIYLDRLVLHCPTLLIHRRNIEKLFVTSVRIASKVVDLRSVNNKNFANVFSMSTS